MNAWKSIRRLAVLALVVAVGAACAPSYYSGPQFIGTSAVGPPAFIEVYYCLDATSPTAGPLQFSVTATGDGAPVDLRFEVTGRPDEFHTMSAGQNVDFIGLPRNPDCFTFKVTNVSPGRDDVSFSFWQWFPYG